MRKLYILLLTIFLTTLSANAYVTIVNRSKKQCFPGCGSSIRNKALGTFFDAATQTFFNAWVITITCEGYGTLGCPSQLAVPDADNSGISSFDITQADLLLNYAYNESANSNPNGSHIVTVVNAATSETWSFRVTWTTLTDGTENVVVEKELI